MNEAALGIGTRSYGTLEIGILQDVGILQDERSGKGLRSASAHLVGFAGYSMPELS
jgi:hypothetical protein